MPESSSTALQRSARGPLTWTVVLTTVAVLVLLVLPKPVLFTRPAEYLPIHTLLEMAAITVQTMVFSITWNVRSRQRPAPYLILGCGMLAAAVLDTGHALSYEGMPLFVTASSPEKAIDFWLTGRLFIAVTILLAALLPWRPLRRPVLDQAMLAAALLAAFAVSWTILLAPELFPRTFIPGEGLTSFKRAAEVVIIALQTVAALLLWRRADRIELADPRTLAAAAWILALAELFFLAYSNVRDLYNLFGHLYRMLGALLIYRAVFVHGVQLPYERLHSLVSALSEGVVMLGRNGAVLTYNSAARRILGLRPEQLAGREPFEALRRPDGTPPPAEEDPVVTTLSSGIPVRNAVLELQQPDGDVTWVSVNTEPLNRDGESTPYAMVASFTDITHLKRTEAEVREVSERLGLATAAAGIGIWDLDLASGRLVWDAGMFPLYAMGPDEFEGTFESWRRRVHPDDLPATEERFRRVLRGEGNFDTEFRIVLPSGYLRTIKAFAYVERDAQGQPLRILGTNWDISSLKDAEQRLSHVVNHLSRHDFEVTTINHMTDLLLSCTNEAEAYPIIANAARQLFEGPGALAVATAGAALMNVVARWHDNTLLDDSAFSADTCWGIRRGQAHEVTPDGGEPVCAHVTRVPPQGYLCLPLAVRGELLGLLHLTAPPSGTRSSAWRQLAGSFAEAIKLGLSNLRLRESLQQQALRDPLTGLYNRRYLEETLPRELHRSQRSGLHLSVALLDIDHFKRVNDTFGHDAGDTVLKRIGVLLREGLRRSDIACRYGGEEFVLVLPETTQEDAMRRAEALRVAVAETPMAHEGAALENVTVSIGVAEAPSQADNAGELIRSADAALYQAKREGRNRVVAARQGNGGWGAQATHPG